MDHMSQSMSMGSMSMGSMSMTMAPSATAASATMSMAMSGMASATGSAMAGMASATSTAMSSMSSGSMSMGGMDMGGSGGATACQISMLWNWNVEDSCFLAKSWHVTSRGMFAGSCIGVICFVIAVEFVRRLHREYDRYILRQWNIARSGGTVTSEAPVSTGSISGSSLGSKIRQLNGPILTSKGIIGYRDDVFLPSLFQQFVRSVFYVLTAGGGYLIMLLLMYFNGYIFFCILIGAFIGFFVFESDTIARSDQKDKTCC